jgi:hypothetical protein
MLTLYTTPVIYLFFDRLATRFSGKKMSERAVPKPVHGVEPVPGVMS